MNEIKCLRIYCVRRRLLVAGTASVASVGWTPCPRGQPLTAALRNILLSKNCRLVRYATCGSWARYALPTLRSLKTAKALGLAMPQTVMVRADRVIE